VTLNADPVLSHLENAFEPAVERLKALLRIPSVGTDPAFQSETRQAAGWLAEDLASIGFEARLVETPGQPAVVAHHPGPGTAPGGAGVPHVLYYGHYDVQPAEPLELWHSPPFEPTVVEGRHGSRIVARGAVDDKGQTMTFIEAFRAWQAVHGGLPVRVTVFLEGEEESGSPSLEGFLAEHKEELGADVCVLSDTMMWDIETPALGIMLRGLVYLELVLEGPGHDLHSGLYGGAVPNPLNILARMLGELHDEAGRVRIPGFYDGIEDMGDLTAAWEALGFDEAAFLQGAGLSHPSGEAGRSTLERIWARPTCDLNGLFGGYTGPGAKTVIPSRASAKLSCRLVPGQDPAAIRGAIAAFLEARVPKGCRLEIIDHGSSPAIRVDTGSPYLKAAVRALGRVFDRPPALVGMGGSVPAVEAIKRHLGMDASLMGFGLDDDRIHSPNEKFELRCFENGIRAHALLLGELAGS
jgi:acetylornithine deacetylase/succinyl-diaminopimelate desuccinylase-like protein